MGVLDVSEEDRRGNAEKEYYRVIAYRDSGADADISSVKLPVLRPAKFENRFGGRP